MTTMSDIETGVKAMRDIETAMIDALKGAGVFGNNIGSWAGQADELLANPKRTPSAWISYQGATYAPRTLLGIKTAGRTESWSVLLFLSMLKGLQTSADIGVYRQLAAVRWVLTGLAVNGSELWPVGDRLIESVNGLLVYDVRFTITINDY